MNVKACAKINLCLDIVDKLDSGYHDMKMVMQQLALADEISLEEEPEGEIFLSVRSRTGSFETTPAAPRSGAEEGRPMPAAAVPCPQDNLMWKAAALLKESCGLHAGVRMQLVKRIPAAAGLGGGSADAAAVLTGMNQLLGLGLSVRELCELGVKIGADVPFCILGGTALAEGIGEILTPLCHPVSGTGWQVLLAKPAQGLSTPEMFAAFDSVPEEERFHPPVREMWEALQNGDEGRMLKCVGNSFSKLAEGRIPLIRKLREEMLNEGAAAACMSGSGPTVFGLFRDRVGMMKAEQKLRPMLEQGLLSDLIPTAFI